jgi:hypothetical protein
MRTKQAENETADRAREMEEREREAREKDVAQAFDFLIRRCMSVLNIMEVRKGKIICNLHQEQRK